MKIKTIWNRLVESEVFDAEVNGAIEEGWQLVEHRFIPGSPLTPNEYRPCMLYARLVLPEPPAEPVEPDLFACAEAIRQECARCKSCTECLLENVCTCVPPHEWQRPSHD